MRTLLALSMVSWIVSAAAHASTVNALVSVVDPERNDKSTDNSNVVIWLTPSSGFSLQAADIAKHEPRQVFQLLQRRKHFEPHLLVVPVGSVVDFPNLDPFFHNVFSLFEGKRFDLGLYEAGTTHRVTFDRPGVAYIFCNIHPEMSAVIVALNTPYYAVSNRNGQLTVADVSPGRYLLSVWYERALPEELEHLSREVTITPDDISLGTIDFVGSTNVLDSHKNKYGQEYDSPNPSDSLYGQ